MLEFSRCQLPSPVEKQVQMLQRHFGRTAFRDGGEKWSRMVLFIQFFPPGKHAAPAVTDWTCVDRDFRFPHRRAATVVRASPKDHKRSMLYNCRHRLLGYCSVLKTTSLSRESA